MKRKLLFLLVFAVMLTAFVTPVIAAAKEPTAKGIDYRTISMDFEFNCMPTQLLSYLPQLEAPQLDIDVEVRFYESDNQTPFMVDDDVYKEIDKKLSMKMEKYRGVVGKSLNSYDKAREKALKLKTREKKVAAIDKAIKSLNSDVRKKLFEEIADEVQTIAEKAWKAKADSISKKKGIIAQSFVRINSVLIPRKKPFISRLFKLFKTANDREAAFADSSLHFIYRDSSGVATDGKTVFVDSKMIFLDGDYYYLDEPSKYLHFSFGYPVDLDAVTVYHVYDAMSEYLKAEAARFEPKLVEYDNRIQALSDDPDRDTKVEKIIAELNTEYKALNPLVIEGLQEAINKVVDDYKTRKGDSTKYKAKVVLKSAWHVFKISVNIAKIAISISEIVASEGTAISAWKDTVDNFVDLGNSLYSFGKMLKKAFDGIQSSLERLDEEMQKLSKLVEEDNDFALDKFLQKKNVIKQISEVEGALEEYHMKVQSLQKKLSGLLESLDVLLCAQEQATGELAANEDFKSLITQTNEMIENTSGLFANLNDHITFSKRAQFLIKNAKELAGTANMGLVKNFLVTQIASIDVKKIIKDKIAAKLGVGPYVTAAENLLEVAKSVQKKLSK